MENGGERFNWGKSLPVPSIQEIVKSDLHSVPERYVHENMDRPVISENLADSLEIPFIDFSSLAKGDEDEIKKLHLACKDWGFFQLINHGVKEELLEKMKAAASAFYELPLDEKNKYAKSENEIQGYGQNFVVSENQKLDWSDMIYLITVPSENRKYKFWPLTLPGFKETLEEYSREMQKVAEEIQANFSVLMGLERDGLKRLQGELKQGIRMNYYPICARPDIVLGISPHSDGTSFTLLLQDDQVTGLQIKHKDAWIPVKPVPNSLVVNVGDATEIQSNGMYKSIEHRGVTNEKKPRISIATFMFPDDEQEIGPLETMIDDQNHPKLYRNIKYVDFVREKFSRKMQGKSHTEFVKLYK
ncbi:putative 2-oxoglutarate (2OG) and Fe(II)-dependent oxygenase superfamily protein [Hibiscus syriacus]|uniref:2-oxoglutarate (2OG) and Fe(II)-dependent oxygenase superfamily protein n=1 Tax=Hibiscus syriacus TaxID=106335 RepID=A0A6A3C798_HIBSY|nr:protein SRG1-like [Hibiscus syriacus]KAE8723438.1 putative 2-oxoglutarate (2OG) and Fe(II)-dependent oxygenase superfamily protein [Hibiscus syriacus]